MLGSYGGPREGGRFLTGEVPLYPSHPSVFLESFPAPASLLPTANPAIFSLNPTRGGPISSHDAGLHGYLALRNNALLGPYSRTMPMALSAPRQAYLSYDAGQALAAPPYKQCPTGSPRS